MCIDWDDEDPNLVYGKDKDAHSQFIDVVLAPCNYIHDEINENTTETVPKDCIVDR